MDNRVILVVDDDPHALDLIQMVLEGERLHVERAANRKEALAHLHERRLSLVMLDAQLPDLSCVVIVRTVRAIYHTLVPIILIGCDTSVEAVAARLGGVSALTKPFRADELLWEVRRALGSDVKR